MTTEPVRFDLEGSDGHRLAGYRWDPSVAPLAAIQLAHGVGEYALRYAPLAEQLASAGFVVVAHDHRGHGSSVEPGEEYGVLGESGWSALVADLGSVGSLVRSTYPSLQLTLIAHSLGSFATQQFLLDRSAEVDAVVLSGTASIDLLEPAMDLDAAMDLAMFNAPFQPARTDFDWLSRDEAQVDAYIADPLCGFGLDVAGGKAMFVGARALADPAVVARMRNDLPVLIAVGDMDPVNGGLALVQVLVDRYRQAGLTNVSLKTYPGARHEIFNETNRQEVVADVIAWLGGNLSVAQS
ncbi:MAG: Monoacylglycerol lipase [Marmoricola sp.]|nr:Monoacylglycerol lipase [Marmoricola sp.]